MTKENNRPGFIHSRTDESWEDLRKKAETLLSSGTVELQTAFKGDIDRLIHDLHVHQIELELQNQELREAQKRLEESRDAFSRLYNQAPIGYLTLDRHGRIGRCNQTFLDMVGGSCTGIMGSLFSDWIQDEDRPIFLARFHAFFKQPTGKTIQLKIRNGQGTFLPVRLTGRAETGRPVSETGDQPQPHLLLLVTDISELLQATDLARERNALIESLFRCLPFDVWARDTENRLILQNEYSIGIRGNQIGKRPEDARETPPQTVQKWVENNRRALAGEVVQEEVQEPSRTVFNIITPIRDGERIIGTAGVNIDITARKQVEESLRISEERYRLLAETAKDIILIHDLQGRIDYINRAGLDHFGGGRDQILGRNLSEFIPPEHREHLMNNAREREMGFTGTRLYQIDILAPGGILLPVEISSSPIIINGRTIGYLAICRDVSERKRAESERLEMERRLLHAQKLESLGVLAGGIAHDFNNLLAAILGNLDLARSDLPPDDEVRQNVENAIRASERARDLTRQMLAYSGRGAFVVRPLVLNDLVQENSRMLRIAMSPTVTLDLRLAEDLPAIVADAGQIQQIVMNLITNASEALRDRPGKVFISTTCVDMSPGVDLKNFQPERVEPGRYVQLMVSDNGCGMDGETCKRMYDPFFTTKFMGRGLGMSAVLGIVRGHKGAIQVESEVGKGTTIRVLFPIAPGDGEKTPFQAPKVRDAAGGGPERHASGTFLVVDDDEMVRDLCAAMVRRCGYQTLVAGDGAEALRIFDDHASEIIGVILDLMMPTMDGVAAFEAFKIRKPDLRIFLSSGYTAEDVLPQFHGQSVAGFLHKPYEFQVLQDLLARRS